MKKQVLIIESHRKQRNRIIHEVRETASEINKKVHFCWAKNIAEAENFLRYRDVDLLILNTVYRGMPLEDVPGIRLVEKLRKVEKYVSLPVVFIYFKQEMMEYAYKELNCLGFLPQLFDDEEFRRVVKRGLHHTTRHDEEEYIYLRKQSTVYPVMVKDIVYVEIEDRLLHLYLQDGSVLEIPHVALTDFAEEVNCRCVVQCNRSMLVNANYVEKENLSKNILKLKSSDMELKIGPKYKRAVLAALR